MSTYTVNLLLVSFVKTTFANHDSVLHLDVLCQTISLNMKPGFRAQSVGFVHSHNCVCITSKAPGPGLVVINDIGVHATAGIFRMSSR